MQQIETAVGEDDAAAVAFLAAKPQNRFFDSQNPWVQRNSMKARAKTALVLSERLVYHARDDATLWGRASAMKSHKMIRAALGAGLCGVGLWLALTVPYHPHTFRIGAGGCRLVTDIVEPTGGVPDGGTPQGYVVLLHGLSANKRIMSYLAMGFASEGLARLCAGLAGTRKIRRPVFL